MSIKGYSTQKKSLQKLSSFTELQSETTSEFATLQQNSSNKVALDTNSLGLTRLHGVAKTAEANTVDTKRVLKSTAHGALKGDVIRFELSSQNPYFESTVLSVPDANTIILAAELENPISTGDAFFILRGVSQRFDESGSVVTSSGPVQFVLNGSTQQVQQDTVTPANSIPLPIQYLNTSGVRTNISTETSLTAMSAKLPAALGAQTIANSMAVNIASNQTVPVSATSLPLPTGAATETTLSGMSAKLPATLGAKTIANAMAVSIASDQTVPVSAASLPLPTGAATETTLSGMSGKLPATLGAKTITASMAVNIASDQTVPVSAAALPLPTGAATSALQTTGNTSLSSIDGKLPATLGQKVSASSLAVVLPSDQNVNTKQIGKSTANAPVRNDYTSTSVTTAAYTQLVASLTTACTEIEIFDSSGQTLTLATGGAGSETNQINIFPGGNGRIPLAIAAGTRISIKALSATASVGEININFYA